MDAGNIRQSLHKAGVQVLKLQNHRQSNYIHRRCFYILYNRCCALDAGTQYREFEVRDECRILRSYHALKGLIHFQYR